MPLVLAIVAEIAMPQLRITTGPTQGQTHTVTNELLQMGREAEFQVPDPAASRRHAEVFCIGDMFFIRDLGGLNGTLLNGERLSKDDQALLRFGDLIRIGATEMVFEEAGGRATEVAPPSTNTEDTAIVSPHAAAAFGFSEVDTVLLEGVDPTRLAALAGKYQPIKTLARGGMGSVILVQEKLSRRFVALKIMKEEHYKDESLVQQFVREAVITARLQHPGIIPVYDLGFLTERILYYTMKFVDGRRLADTMGSSDLHDNLNVLLSACRAVHFAHSHSLWHRDLKPQNILVGREEDTYVIDWGLVSVSNGREYRFDLPTITMDRASYVLPDNLIAETADAATSQIRLDHRLRSGRRVPILGTPGYISPEQVLANEAFFGPLCDVWSLGVILYEILVGTHPIIQVGPDSRDAILARTAERDIPDPRARAPEVPDRLAEICLNMVRRDPAKRIWSLGPVIQDLTSYLKRSTGSASMRIGEEDPAKAVDMALDRFFLAELARLREENGKLLTQVDRYSKKADAFLRLASLPFYRFREKTRILREIERLDDAASGRA